MFIHIYFNFFVNTLKGNNVPRHFQSVDSAANKPPQIEEYIFPTVIIR